MARLSKNRKHTVPHGARVPAPPLAATERIGDLARAGQHAQALELATAELAAPGASVAKRPICSTCALKATSRRAIFAAHAPTPPQCSISRGASGPPHRGRGR